MPTISLSAGQSSAAVELGPNARVTASGSGYVQWSTGSLADAQNGVAVWRTWPMGSTAGSLDVLRRLMIRAVATSGAYTVTYIEGGGDAAGPGNYWDADQMATVAATLGSGLVAYDDFGRADSLLYGSFTPSGHAWDVSGAGAATAEIEDGRLVTSDTIYAYLDTGSAVTRADCSFSLELGAGTNDLSTAMLVLLIDNGLQSLNTMVHWIISPTTWTLQKRVSGGSLVDVESGTHVLLTGARYSCGIERRSSTTVRLHLPNGNTQDVTDGDFANMTWRYPAWEMNPTANSLVPRLEAVSVGPQYRGGMVALTGAAPIRETAWLKGERLTLRQRVEFTTAATAGWYRIATNSGWTTFEIAGTVRLSARDAPGRSQYNEFQVRAFYNSSGLTATTMAAGTGNLVEIFSHRNAAGSPFTIARLSTNAAGFAAYLDLYQANAEAAEGFIEFEGIFTPAQTLTVGATAGATDDVELTFL